MKKVKNVARRSKKAGLAPGELVHVGEVKAQATSVTAFLYDADGVEERSITDFSQLPELTVTDKHLWLNIDGLYSVDWIQKIGEAFRLHPLVLEDVLNPQQRPRREEFDNYLFVVVKALALYPERTTDDRGNRIAQEQISLFIGSKFLLTFQEKIGDSLNTVRERLLRPESRMRHLGSDFLAYACLDSIIDKYFEVLEVVGDDVDTLETEIVSGTQPDSLSKLYAIKREVLGMRRIIWPTRELVNGLERGDTPLIHRSTLPFLRDVYSHCLEAVEILEMQREVLSGLLDVYLSSISNGLNNVMKVLTVLTTIFMPLTVVTGIYGMNFDNMPELHWRYGYYYVLGLMLLVATVMLAIFRKQRWL